MKLKIVVDPKLCFGAAACVTVSPMNFRLNNENKASVLEHGEELQPDDRTYDRILEVDEAKKQELINAAKSCPVAAISIYDAETGEKLV